MELAATSETTTLTNTEFENKIKQTTFEMVPPDVARDTIKALYSKLVEKGQMYSADPNSFNLNSATFMPRPEKGGIFSISGKDKEDSYNMLSVFINANNKIIGYGGFTETKDSDEAIASFKIFPEGRGTPQAAIDIFNNNLFNYLASSPKVPNKIVIPTTQQYNPSLGEKPTGAPIFYRKMGFTTPTDVSLPNELYQKLQRFLRGEREFFNDSENVQLSQHPLEMNIDKNNIQKIRSDEERKLKPASNATQDILRAAIEEKESSSTVTKRPGNDRLSRLAEKIKNL